MASEHMFMAIATRQALLAPQTSHIIPVMTHRPKYGTRKIISK